MRPRGKLTLHTLHFTSLITTQACLFPHLSTPTLFSISLHSSFTFTFSSFFTLPPLCCFLSLILQSSLVEMAMAISSVSVTLRPHFPPSPFHSRRYSFAKPLRCLATKQNLPETLEIESRPKSETVLHSFSPLPLLYAAALLPGGSYFTSIIATHFDFFKF